MPQSTPLDQLSQNEGQQPPADEERVKRILAEMNVDGLMQSPPGQQAMPRVITEPPVAMSTGELRMDPGTSRAHVIGNSSPTPADFHSMFQQTSSGMAPFNPVAAPSVMIPVKSSVDWRAAAMAHLRAPLAVALIVFLLNMPVVTLIISRYASWMYLSSGEISIGGLIVKALLAATLFAAYQGVSSFF